MWMIIKLSKKLGKNTVKMSGPSGDKIVRLKLKKISIQESLFSYFWKTIGTTKNQIRQSIKNY